MKISVTLAFHNELEFLPGWFASVRTYADEIICASHTATDGSLEYVKSQTDIPIKIIEFPENTIFEHGFSYMKNECIKLATGDWVVCLDADEEMDITKEKLEPWTENRALRALALSTVTMHTDDTQWDLNDRATIKREGNFIKQRHWRIFRNHIGIEWKGIVHEELRTKDKIHVARWARNTSIPMWHLGSLANKSKRTFKEGLYAELIVRMVEQPELREGTNSYWYTRFYNEHKEQLHAQRDEYRKLRGI